MLTIKPIRADHDDVICLIKQLDDLMIALYPPQSNHLDDVSELIKPNVCFVGGFVDEKLAGIGAIKVKSDDQFYGEIKRVFVQPNYRGQKIAEQILTWLEDYLLQQDIYLVRLETGDKQPQALKLFENLGYKARGPFGEYGSDPHGIFMEKSLIR